MSLKLKLLLSFFAVLLLTLLVGFWGLRGMKIIERGNFLGDTVSEGAAHLQSAQAEQMKYFLNGDAAYVKATKDYLAEAKEHFGEVAAGLPAHDAYQPRLKELMNDVDAMLGTFDKLLRLTEDLARVDDDYTVQGKTIVATLNELIAAAYERQSRELTLDSARAVKQMTDARAKLYEVRWSTWLVTTDPTRENVDIVLTGIKHFVEALKLAESSIQGQANRTLMQRLLDEVETYRNFVRQSGDMTTQRQQLVLESGSMADEAVHRAEALTEAMTDDSAAAQRSIALQLIAVAAAAVVLGLALALLITRNVLGQLGRDPGVLAGMARRVSSGDYAIDDGRPRRGVYGDFVSMVQALRDNMDKARQESEHAQAATAEAREAARQAEDAKREAQNARREGMLNAAVKLEDVVAVVSSASEELAAQIEQSERGANHQASRVTETATAMEEMNSTVLEVARNAGDAADVSTSTRQKAEAGAAVVRQAVDSIRQVQAQSLQLKNDMNTLDENARAISQIMGVISDIADQTNLLALNAAIEAARAGDAGRGFAVVADEVRNLAEKTMASTADVAKAIRDIQESASQSRAQVDQAVATIGEATELARRSGDALQEIVELTDRTADQVRAIATASEEQSASSEEINRSIAEVNTIASETSQAMNQAARAVSDLASQAQVLGRLIDDMKRG